MFTITQGKGFQIEFANGWTISVQFGAGNYCDNYDGHISENAWRAQGENGCPDAEVWAWPTQSRKDANKYEPIPDAWENPVGRCNPEEVAQLIATVVAYPAR